MIGHKLKKLREWKNLTQEYVAEQLDISPRTYGKLESGESKMTVDRLEKILETFEVPLEDFFKMDADNIFQHNKFVNKSNVNGFVVNNHSNETESPILHKLMETLDSFCETNRFLLSELKRIRKED